MDKRVYWIWLQQALKYGNYKIKYICDLYKNDIESFFKAKERDWRLCGFFTNNDIDALNSSSIESAQQIFEQCYRLSYDIVVPFDGIYPDNLWHIANPPAVLYVLGNSSVLKSKIKIAVVGTRNASFAGEQVAEEVAKRAATSGAIVVSGGALGIDSAAHRGAINAEKPTIAVLGCGINFNYLSQNSRLRYRISKHGALISEYPPDTSAHNYNFPMRNRIISGLSVATIVVEAGQKSGSLITANLANDQGRDVFVVPLNVNGALCSGARTLLEDGAKIVTHIEDLVEYYKYKHDSFPNIIDNDYNNSEKLSSDFGVKNHQDKQNKIENYNLSPNTKACYKLLCQHKKLYIDKIGELLNLDIKYILASLTELELNGLIRVCPGKFYEIL